MHTAPTTSRAHESRVLQHPVICEGLVLVYGAALATRGGSLSHEHPLCGTMGRLAGILIAPAFLSPGVPARWTSTPGDTARASWVRWLTSAAHRTVCAAHRASNGRRRTGWTRRASAGVAGALAQGPSSHWDSRVTHTAVLARLYGGRRTETRTRGVSPAHSRMEICERFRLARARDGLFMTADDALARGSLTTAPSSKPLVVRLTFDAEPTRRPPSGHQAPRHPRMWYGPGVLCRAVPCRALLAVHGNPAGVRWSETEVSRWARPQRT